MKIIFIKKCNQILSSVIAQKNDFRNFIAQHKIRGNGIFFTNCSKQNFDEYILEKLASIKLDSRAWENYHIWIYTTQSMTLPTKVTVNGITWRVECINIDNILQADFWQNEIQKQIALDKIGSWIHHINAYKNLTNIATYPESDELSRQRGYFLADAMKQGEFTTEASHFIEQWGENISAEQVTNIRPLIDREKQFSQDFCEEDIYFRSDDFEPGSRLFDDYLAVIRRSYTNVYGKEPNKDLCIPIDRNYANLNKILDSNNFKIFSEEQGFAKKMENSPTSQHYIIIFDNKDEYDHALDQCRVLGLMPTPAKMRERIARESQSKLLSHIKECRTLPLRLPVIHTLNDLLCTPMFNRFKQLSSIKNPELPYLKIYHSIMVNLLEGLHPILNQKFLPAAEVDFLKHSYSFLWQYMAWAILYKDNHQRSTQIFSWMMEEIVLHLLILKPYGANDFSILMKQYLYKDYQAFFTAIKTENLSVDFNIGLFNSGMRSLFEIANQFNSGRQMIIIKNSYYEIGRGLWHNIEKLDFPDPDFPCDANIYIANVSTLVSEKLKNMYATDAVGLVNYIFNNRRNPSPFTLIIDITLLDETSPVLSTLIERVAEPVSQGRLNLVFFKSLQKYGMAGTDKVQAGYVWTVNNNKYFKSFNDQITSEETQLGYLDRQFICHLYKYAYPQLREYLELSHHNGLLLRQIMPTQINGFADKSPFQFEVTEKYPERKTNPFFKFYPYRGSFGFADTTLMTIDLSNDEGAITRISAGIEGESKLTLIHKAIHKSLSANYTEVYKELVNILNVNKRGVSSLIPEVTLRGIMRDLYYCKHRDYLSENSNEILKLIIALLIHEQNHPNDSMFNVINKFTLLNLVLRYHKLAMPVEIYKMLWAQLIKSKQIVYQGLKNAPGDFNLYFVIFKFKKDFNLEVNIEILNKFRDHLNPNRVKENDIFSYIIRQIDNYLMKQGQSKQEKMSLTFNLAFEIVSFLYQLSKSKNTADLQANFYRTLIKNSIYNVGPSTSGEDYSTVSDMRLG